jgi:hypothetical protein
VLAGTTGNWAPGQTSVIHNNTSQNGPAISALRTTGTTVGIQYSENAGLVAESEVVGEDAIIGFGPSGPAASGVHGYAFDGRGVAGTSDQGVGVLGEIRFANAGANTVAVLGNNTGTGTGAVGVKGPAIGGSNGVGGSFEGSLAPLRLVPASTVGAPTSSDHAAGELFVDHAGQLFFCTSAGKPGTWVQLTAAATASGLSLHPVSPTRVYDSREAQPAPGPLSTNQTRTISIADGRDIKGGAVTVPDLVPAGATAIAYNFTVTNTIGAGYLTVNPGGNTTVASSAINWSASGQILTTGSLVAINAGREVTVIAGGPGATDFLIDVVGYYL